MVSTESKGLSNLSKSRTQPPGLDTCFICDQRITGERLKLSTTCAPHSKLGLAEKVSNLIGDEFVVIVTDNDLVCKRCSSLLNHMDKLENELVLVKKAIINYLKQKYELPIEEPTLLTASNYSDDEESNDEDDIAEKSSQEPAVEVPAQPVTPQPSPATPITNLGMTASPVSVQNRKRPAPTPTPKVMPIRAKPDPPVAQKMKIYKCGFCIFQSKDLNTVRLHMKVHVKTNVKSDESIAAKVQPPVLAPAPAPQVSVTAPQVSLPTPPVSTSATQVSTPTVAAPTAVKRRLFRCQVCSLSFDDRSKCVEHISLEHTSIGKKRALEEKQKQLAAASALGAKDKLTQPDSSTSGVKGSSTIADDSVSSFGNGNDWNTGDSAVTDSGLNSDGLHLDQYSSTQQSAQNQSVKEERELQQSVEGYGMETDPVGEGTGIGTVKEDPSSNAGQISVTAAVPGSDLDMSVDGDTADLLNAGDKPMETENDDNKEVHSIDIAAMIAALHSDGPQGQI